MTPPPRIFSRGDALTALAAALVAFAVYAWTAAPSITLLDAGEFAVAAQHFGVPHPTGYPLWTLLAWLFSLLPLGNVAWQLALFSGLLGALAVGLTALVIRSSARWIAPDSPRLATIAALSLSLCFAFSESMWSQAVIIEVYTLHALLVGLYLTSLYVWLRRPERLGPLYAAVFLFALAFSNHQLTLALAPLPFLVVALVRRDLFWDLLLACLLACLVAYLAFALIADSSVIIKAAIRLALLVLTLLVLVLLARRGRVRWPLLALVPLLLFGGLLPYAYLPVASGTNPPMNWGYTRTPEGFFHSFNRSQYPGSLSDLSLRVLSRTLGVAPEDASSISGSVVNPDAALPLAPRITRWTSFFWARLIDGFTPLGLLFLLVALLATLRLPLPARTWIYLLTAAFCLAMGLQPILEAARTDKAGWWLQMPYHTYTNGIFALLAGLGAFLTARALAQRTPRLAPASAALLLLPLWPLTHNAASSSQRDRWFGWEYGRDLLAPLPPGAILFGGTDPGRFIPTYLIFGESTLPPARRIDPAFDRRDLYILTQNGLADPLYLRYVRDHYTTQRPPVRNAFERWLGRDHAYPATPLTLPTRADLAAITQQVATELRGKRDPATLDPAESSRLVHAAVARWIFERNKAAHPFYVEESFPMAWTDPYAIPDGPLTRLAPEPLATLPPDAINRDFAYWDATTARLLAHPQYFRDYDAQRSYSHLRLTGARLYQRRQLPAEAERAYRQALALWPESVETLLGLSQLLWTRGEFDEPITLFDRALATDPRNPDLLRLRRAVAERKTAQADNAARLAAWRARPTDLAPLARTLETQSRFGLTAEMDALLREADTLLPADPGYARLASTLAESRLRWDDAARAADRWTRLQPQSPEAHYRLARARYALEDAPGAATALAAALRLGGIEYRERLVQDPAFATLREVPEVQRLLLPPPPTAPAPR